MATIEIAVDETGKVDFNNLPEALKPAFQKEFDRAFGKGKTAKEAELAEKLAKPEDAAELARLREEARKRDLEDDEKARRYEEAKAKLTTDAAAERTRLEAEVQRREARIRAGLAADIRAAALQHGARDESLKELEALLAPGLDLDGEFRPVVKGEDGKPLLDAKGAPVTVEAHVKAYLDSHAHHRKAAGVLGGGAPGGAALRGVTGHTDRDAAVAAVQERPTPEAAGKVLANAGKR